MFPGEKHIQSELTNIFGLTYIMSLPISPSAGAIVDCFAKRYRQSEDDDIKGRTVGVAFVCGFVSIFTAILSVLCAFKNMAVASKHLYKLYLTCLIIGSYRGVRYKVQEGVLYKVQSPFFRKIFSEGSLYKVQLYHLVKLFGHFLIYKKKL